MRHYDIIIVGGGLAGLTAAIHLSRENYAVLVLEKKTYPHHKVCGEYVSNEIIPYLNYLEIPIGDTGAVVIDTLKISTTAGKLAKTKLPLGGIGISRYAFDHLLYQKAASNGVVFVFDTVISVDNEKNAFQVDTEKNGCYTSEIVIGAYGKRSILDKQLQRDFIASKSSWLGVKGHYEFDEFPKNQVALHNFKGGYGGLSKTETGAVNFCYLTSYDAFKKEKNIDSFNTNVVAQNPFLGEFLSKAKPVFAVPLTIAQISFEPKKAVEHHILMCGDSAGLIHPLCGNGMAMAIHSAKIVSEYIHKYFKTPEYSRDQLEKEYEIEWKNTFERRLWMGRKLQSVLLNERLSNIALKATVLSPILLRKAIKTTHGKPILC